MYLVKTPQIIRKMFPNFVWSVSELDRVLYLTFDDGPHPEVTPWVLEQLKPYDAKATFFCVGDNVQKYPDTFDQLLYEGHTVGNHTFNHLNGWTTDNLPYFHNVRHCARLINSEFFRPPYGRLKPKQVQFLQRHYQIVMWDVLSGDFDTSINGMQCFRNVAHNAGPGSIVVFHDSEKARKNMMASLPKVLEHFHKLGYRFEALQPSRSNIIAA